MIPRWKAGLGLDAGILLSLSSIVHSIAGEQDLRNQLEVAATSLELVRDVMLGWHFGGIAMLVFGVVVIHSFLGAWRGGAISLFAPRVIGMAYLIFGLVAIALVERNPFYLVFVLPGGTLLLACGLGSGGSKSS